MNFTSFHFLVFFFVTIVLGHLLKDYPRPLRIFLLLSSYYFYGVFKPEYLLLVLFSTLIDYLAAIGIYSHRKDFSFLFLTAAHFKRIPERVWLLFSIVTNLGILGFFKYTNFGLEIVNDVLSFYHPDFRLPYLDIVLPVGISFYTFQSMSYTIDVYRGILTPRFHFVDFALYVTFFPQLVAGPIVRATNFFRQMDMPEAITFEDYKIGFLRILTGYFKKLVLADNLAVAVNAVFANPHQYHPLDIWIASLGFGWQIYLDFSGYTDIARGCARFFGYELEINFLYPMAAANITEHWRRWHISLTTWLRDYLYIPLGGSRVSTIRLYLNMFLVWFATGLWHGASYHFLAWGIWQYVMIVIHRNYEKSPWKAFLHGKFPVLWNIMARLLLFFSLNFGFIWFRAESLEKANFMIGRLFGFENITESWKWMSWFPPVIYSDYILLLVFLWSYEFFMQKNEEKLYHASTPVLVFYNFLMIFSIFVFTPAETPKFLYFQF